MKLKKEIERLVLKTKEECETAAANKIREEVPKILYSSLNGVAFTELIFIGHIGKHKRQLNAILTVLQQNGSPFFKSRFVMNGDDFEYISYPSGLLTFDLLDKRNFFIFQDKSNDEKNEVSIRIFGIDHKKWGKRLLKMAENMIRDTDNYDDAEGKKEILVFTSNEKGEIMSYWKAGRGIDNIVLPSDARKEITSFLDKWKQDRDYYSSIEEDFKTGLIFYGEPGVGKSSICKAIYDYLGASTFYVVNGSRIEKDIENLTYLREQRKGVFVIVLEDFDTFFSNGDRKKDGLTKEDADRMQLLLQFLDGAKSLTEVVYVATTNHIEKLDDALVRAGRFDFCLELKCLDESLAKTFCKNMSYDPVILEEMNLSFPISPVKLRKKILERRQRQVSDDKFFLGVKK